MNQQNNKTEEEFMRDLEDGKYRDFYLLYNRKSTDETENQKNSIEYQKSENLKFAQLKRLPIAKVTHTGFCVDGIISEKHSGYKESNKITFDENGLAQFKIDRPKFGKLVQLLVAGHFKGIICLSWDRASRNKVDDSLIRKMMRNGIDFQFAFATYDDTSSGHLHMDIDGMFAAHHSRVTSEKVSATIRNSREKGWCTHRAPIGYLNNGSMQEKPFDPERAPVIKRMFELYSTGSWSLSDLVRFCNDQGFTTVPMKRRRTKVEMLAEEGDFADLESLSRPVNENHISRILNNPFYTGKVPGPNNDFIQSTSHFPLVSEGLFLEVQGLLKKKKVSTHYTKKLDLALRGIIRCDVCGRVYTPYMQKGIEYFNSRCRDGCENPLKNFNFNFIQAKVGELLSGLCFKDNELEEMDARMGTDIALLENSHQKEIDQLERKKKKIREDLAYLRSNKLNLLKTGAYTPEDYLDEESRLSAELADFQSREEVSDTAMHETMKEVIKLSELMKNLIPYYSFANPQEKDKIIRIIFSELTISENTLTYKCQKGFECFEKRFVTVCDLTENRTPVPGMRILCPSR